MVKHAFTLADISAFARRAVSTLIEQEIYTIDDVKARASGTSGVLEVKRRLNEAILLGMGTMTGDEEAYTIKYTVEGGVPIEARFALAGMHGEVLIKSVQEIPGYHTYRQGSVNLYQEKRLTENGLPL